MQEQLKELQQQKEHDAIEFSVVYAAIEELFNTLQCSWDDSPDGSMTVTATNAMFALGAIELAVADLLTAIGKATPEQ
jgi:hypothetical protein